MPALQPTRVSSCRLTPVSPTPRRCQGAIFLGALLMDATDVLLHSINITAALHSQFGIGVPIEAHLQHTAETWGTVAALVSTTCAIVGEILASKAHLAKAAAKAAK